MNKNLLSKNKNLLSSILLASLLAMGTAFAQGAGTHTEVDAAATGRGEADISTALVGAMVEAGAATDTKAALATLAEMRAEGMGWGEIAHELGFNLGAVVNAAARAGATARGQGEAGSAIVKENHVRAGVDAGAKVDAAANLSADRNTGAATAASVRTQAEVGKNISVDARANTSLRGSTTGRSGGSLSAPVLPQRVERPARATLSGRL